MVKQKRTKPISFYPLKFEEVISDVLKVKPERKQNRTSSKKKSSKHHQSNRRKKD